MSSKNRSFEKTTVQEVLPSAISHMSMEQRTGVVPVSHGVDQQPDIIYLRQPIGNPLCNGPAYSMRAYAKLPEDFQAGIDEDNPAKVSFEVRNSAKDTAHEPIVNEHQAKPPCSVGMINAQDAVNRKERGYTSAAACNEPAAVKTGSVEVTTNTVGADCNTNIISESSVTATTVACGGMTFNITVNTNRKFTFTQRKLPKSYTPRYVVHAPVNIKIILRDPVSGSSAEIDEHS